VFFFSQKQRLYFLKKDSEGIIQLQSHCLEKHQKSFFFVFFLEQILSIYQDLLNKKKTLSRNFVSDVQTKSSTISFASNCTMSENFKSYVHILYIDNECQCEGSSTNWRGVKSQFCEGNHKSCVRSTYIWQHQCMLFTVKNFTVREQN